MAAKTDLLGESPSQASKGDGLLSRASSAAAQLNVPFYQCSALTGEGVDAIFLETAGIALEKVFSRATTPPRPPAAAERPSTQ